MAMCESTNLILARLSAVGCHSLRRSSGRLLYVGEVFFKRDLHVGEVLLHARLHVVEFEIEEEFRIFHG